MRALIGKRAVLGDEGQKLAVRSPYQDSIVEKLFRHIKRRDSSLYSAAFRIARAMRMSARWLVMRVLVLRFGEWVMVVVRNSGR